MKIGIIGYGKLGQNLADILFYNEILAYLVIKNEQMRKEAILLYPNIIIYSKISEIANFNDINIICVNDSFIEDVAIEISILENDFFDHIFVHCSGLIDGNVLNSIKQKGGIIGSIHPYQTFWTRKVENFNNIPWLVELDEKYDFISQFIKVINGNPIKFIPDNMNKTGYHLSAVIISNYMNLLFQMSKEVSLITGINPEEFIPIIAKTTLENNLSQLSTNGIPITGPVARGDSKTILNHLEFLKEYPSLQNSYKHLTLATLEVIKDKKLLDERKINDIYNIIDKFI